MVAEAPPPRLHPRLQVEHTDLIQFGLIPEFVGRLPIIVALQDLSEDELVRVLSEPKNALCKQYRALLGLSNAKLEYSAKGLQVRWGNALRTQWACRCCY